MRHQNVERLRRHVKNDCQPLAEANSLNIQISLSKVQFPFQRSQVLALILKAHSQQVTQARDHRVRCVHVSQHQRRDGVQGIEQKVRLQLALQSQQFGVTKVGLQVSGAHFPLSIPRVVKDCVGDHNNWKIDRKNVLNQVPEKYPFQRRPVNA